MSKFLNTQNRGVDAIGNGGSVTAKLYDTGGTNFIKNVGAVANTTDTVPFTILVNTTNPAGADFIAIGTDYTIKLDDGTNPEVDATPTGFEVVDAKYQDFPSIAWFTGGSVFSASTGCITESAGTVPCELFEIDPVASAVGKIEGGTAAGKQAITLTQTTTANKPRLKRDAGGRPFLHFTNSAANMALGVSPAITNTSFVETYFTLSMDIGSSLQSFAASLGYGIQLSGNGSDTNTLRIKLGSVSTDVPESVPVTVRAKLSTSAVFGDSELYVNNVLIGTTATYFPTFGNATINTGGTGSNLLNLYAMMIPHDGALTGPEITALEAWFKFKGGIV